MRKQAFSLIELSIVILIIGILIAGVTQSSRLVASMRLATARAQTQSAPVTSIRNLVSWYESTSENSFKSTVDESGAPSIDAWYDVATTTTTKNNAIQNTSGNQPKYATSSVNGLPVVRFDGTDDFLTLPNGTVPYANSPYTIFFVYRMNADGSYGLLGSGTYAVTNNTNAFRTNASAIFVNYWWSVDASSGTNMVPANKFHVVDVAYDLANRMIYVNGTLASTTASSANAATSLNNTIGVTNTTEYMNGDIAEIIIFDRALKTEERQSIEKYLGKKWGIKVS